MSDHEELLVGEFPFMPKQERAQKKRNALLESGHQLFIQNGYEQTTAKEIASHAGVATGTFYRYFSDKRQLLMSLLEDKIDRLMPPEPTWINQDPVALLAERLKAYDQRLKEMGLHRVLSELLTKDPEFADVLAAARGKIHQRIHSGLKQARELGLTWKDLDFESVTWAIITLVESVPKKNEYSENQADYSEISKIICRMVFPPDVLNQLRNDTEN